MTTFVHEHHDAYQQLTVSSVFLHDPLMLARLVAFLGSKNTFALSLLNRQWAKELMKPVVWEILADVPFRPLLINCFRRASSYCYRELDVPSPNVNRRGGPPVIRACLLTDRSSVRDYVGELRHMALETRWFQHTAPLKLRVADIPELQQDNHRNALYFENAKILTNDRCRTHDTRVFSGGLEQDHAHFYLWSLEQQKLRASISQHSASCFHASNDALAIGCNDGSVKIWDFAAVEYSRRHQHHHHHHHGQDPHHQAHVNVPPTATITHRSSLGMMPFIRARYKEKVVHVHVEHHDGTFLHLATATEKGEVNVWDVTKGDVLMTIPAHKIHKSALPRAQRDANPQITSLMLFRSTLVCGTSCGFIRVFDLRSGNLTHRLSGHPDAVLKTDTKGRVLWSAGNEGSVRWWGGKTAKVLSKSALCDGGVSALEMDDNVVVAGYHRQGMEAWDVRTQQSLCSFSNAYHGGVKSLQFDNRKLVTVSTTGKAALWRWNSAHPVYFFDAPTSTTRFVSGHYNDRHLIFGTDNGDLLGFQR